MNLEVSNTERDVDSRRSVHGALKEAKMSRNLHRYKGLFLGFFSENIAACCQCPGNTEESELKADRMCSHAESSRE